MNQVDMDEKKEENKISWIHEDGEKYEIIGPEFYDYQDMEWAMECLLASLKTRFFSHLDEFDLTIPVPPKFYMAGTYFIVKKIED